MTASREARVAECLTPATTYTERIQLGTLRRTFADDLAETLIQERWRSEHIDGPVIESARALVEALRRQQRGFAELSHRARCAVSDLLVALEARDSSQEQPSDAAIPATAGNAPQRQSSETS